MPSERKADDALEFPTLTAMQDRYMKDAPFRMVLQSMVIESYQDKLILVEETDYSPKEVSPGMTVRGDCRMRR